MRATRLLLTLLTVTGAMLAVGASPALASETHLGGPLFGSSSYPSARRHADDESRNGHRDFNVDLWNVGKLAGRTLTVSANGHKVGTMRVGSGGRCHVDRSTDHGQAVPAPSAGATVTVRTGAGTLVASGTLHRMHMM